jgi:hypothetical protein
MSRWRILGSLGQCCLEKVDLSVANGGAAEVLPVSLSSPLPLLITRPPSLLVCYFFISAKMGATSTASGRLEVNLYLSEKGIGGTIYITHTSEPFEDLGLMLKDFRSLLPSSTDTLLPTLAAKFVHTRCALSSTIINSHLEPVSG